MNQNVQGKGNANLRTHWPSCLHFSWLFAFLKVTKQGNLSWARAMEILEISKQNTNLSIWKSKGARAPVADGGKPCGPDRRPLSASAGLSLWCRCVSCICWSTLSDLPQLLRVSRATEMKFQNAPFQLMSHFAFIKNRKTYYLLCIPENPFTRRIITEPCFPCFVASFRNSNPSGSIFPSSRGGAERGPGFVIQNRAQCESKLLRSPKELWTLHNFKFYQFFYKIIADL